MRRRCVSSASPRGSWRAPIPMGEGADHGAVSPRSGRDRQRRLYRLQPDPDLRRARDPRLDGMEDVACGNQRGRASRCPSRDAGDRMGFGSLLSGRHRGPARRSGKAFSSIDLVRLYRNIGTEFLYPAMALVLGLAGFASFAPATRGSRAPLTSRS